MHSEHGDLPASVLNEAGEVIRELAAAGIQIPEAQLVIFARYLHRVREWGRRINLVARGDLSRLGRRHLLESFNVLCHFPPDLAARGPLADAGSGAGFPGLPLALLLPHLDVVLIESVRKKAQFLERVVAEFGLGGRVRVEAERAEVLAGRPEYRGRFAVVTVRGIGPLSRAVRWCAPLLRPGGYLMAFKGTEAVEEELRLAMAAVGAYGLELSDIVPLRWGEGRLILLRRRA
jgi:16S rRNA (guanine527-N7)-methyltransferase